MGEELLNAKGRDMPFLKPAKSKLSSIISAVIVNFAFLKGESLYESLYDKR